LLQSGIGAFILAGRASRSVEQMMVFLLERWPGIADATLRFRPPFIIGVPDRGKLEPLS